MSFPSLSILVPLSRPSKLHLGKHFPNCGLVESVGGPLLNSLRTAHAEAGHWQKLWIQKLDTLHTMLGATTTGRLQMTRSNLWDSVAYNLRRLPHPHVKCTRLIHTLQLEVSVLPIPISSDTRCRSALPDIFTPARNTLPSPQLRCERVAPRPPHGGRSTGSSLSDCDLRTTP